MEQGIGDVDGDEGTSSLTLLPPPKLPRYSEVGAGVFDYLNDRLEEHESSDAIVYASLSTPSSDAQLNASPLRTIAAATAAKLVEKLTHQYGIDAGFMSDFFLTYRLFMPPAQLCDYLIQRYLWALEGNTEVRFVARARTLAVFRHWVDNHFADDFLTSKLLRFKLASFLNGMRSHPKVEASVEDSKTIQSLIEFFKRRRQYHKGLVKQSLMIEQGQHSVQPQQQREDQECCIGPMDPAPTVIQPVNPTRGIMFYESDSKAAEVEQLKISSAQIPAPTEQALDRPVSASDEAPMASEDAPTKGRHRATTLAGTSSESMFNERNSLPSSFRSIFSKEPRSWAMSRRMSEGEAIIVPRGRRASAPSVKTGKSSSTWSTKMTMSISKLRQKSEDIYQQIVNPTIFPGSKVLVAEGKKCVCWGPVYTGITDYCLPITTRNH
ncbi:ras guanine nucleotide exchange factor domain-containing protein, partial [Lobosporangium transversale]